MDAKEAFKIVYDILKQYPLPMGKFDAVHGDEHFIYGMSSLMEAIATFAGCEEEYEEEWSKNFEESLKKKG